MQVHGTSLETINDFLIRELGHEGIIVSSRINEYFENETNQINIALNTQAVNFNAEIDNIDTAVGSLTKKGLNHLAKNVKLDASTIKVARDGLVAGGKFVGLNLKEALKFKPWGAVNLAGNINKALPFLSVAMEAWDTWNQAQKQQKFDEAKKELKENFEKQRSEILKLIDSENFVTDFFPIYKELKTKIDNITKLRTEHDKKGEAFKVWRAEGAIIEGEFRTLS